MQVAGQRSQDLDAGNLQQFGLLLDGEIGFAGQQEFADESGGRGKPRPGVDPSGDARRSNSLAK